MRRPGYREAIEWIAHNDDCYWLADDDGDPQALSVTAAMVRDLYAVDADKLICDLRRALRRAHPTHEVLRRKA